MVKKIATCICLVFLFSSCKKDGTTKDTTMTNNVTEAFNKMLDDYYEEIALLNETEELAGEKREHEAPFSFYQNHKNKVLDNVVILTL